MDATLVALGREALAVALLVSAPPMLAALAVGLVVGVLQAATQVQEPAVGVVPRNAAVLAALAVGGPWMGLRLARFAAAALEAAARGSP